MLPMVPTMEEKHTKCSREGTPSTAACRFHAPSALGFTAVFQLAPLCHPGNIAVRLAGVAVCRCQCTSKVSYQRFAPVTKAVVSRCLPPRLGVWHWLMPTFCYSE